MTDWRDLAACKGWPTDWWFPGQGEIGIFGGTSERQRRRLRSQRRREAVA